MHAMSHADPQGQLFSWEGGLYRGIPAGSVPFTTGLFESGAIRELVDLGLLVGCEKSELSTNSYPLVVKHPAVRYPSYPFEWCGEMLRRAALHTLDIVQVLSRRGLTLKDAHAWNVLFEGCHPLFVDLGSIVAAGSEPARVEQEFVSQFLYPIEFIASGHGRIARWLLHDFERGINVDEFGLIRRLSPSRIFRKALSNSKRTAKRALPSPMLTSLRKFYRKSKRTTLVQSYKAASLTRYRSHLSKVKLPSSDTEWSGYYDADFPTFDPSDSWNAKHRAIHQLLVHHRPATVLDIGANRGWYSVIAAKAGSRVVAFDTDEVSINRLYLDAARMSLDIQPLIMSFSNPTQRLGGGHGMLLSANERFQCDCVLGLALVHHMVFKARLNFNQIATGFAAFTGKILIVEFVPAEDQYVKAWMTDQFGWYRPENFIAALKRHFRSVSTVGSYPSPRVLFVCER